MFSGDKWQMSLLKFIWKHLYLCHLSSLKNISPQQVKALAVTPFITVFQK